VAATQKRQISDVQKQAVLERQGLRCFIDDHPIDSVEDAEFDHVHPFSENGVTAVENIAVVCKRHNREKRNLSLSEYRDRLTLRRFFEGARKRRLDDLMVEKLGSSGHGKPIAFEVDDGVVVLYLDGRQTRTPLMQCPATKEKYFFAAVPVTLLKNDIELQPRALEPERLWELYRHLLRRTQLQPAVCRLVNGSVLLFDGQHKAAAQIWAGRTAIDCKVYLDPEVRQLKETNLSAHDKLRQMPFYTSTLLEKYAVMASEDWEEFLIAPGPKTESAFVEFMRNKSDLSRAEATKRIRSMIYGDILEHPNNQLRDYIAEENRTRENPLTMYRLEKTFFAEFIAPPPLSDEFESEDYHRDEERENFIRLMNLIVARVLTDRWAPERKDAAHTKAARIFSAGALRAWVPFLRDAVAPALQVFEQDERRRLLYRELGDEDFANAERLIDRLFFHKVWEDPSPELNDLRYDNAERAKEMLRRAGLTPNWILGGEG
jgi:ParB-like nuclease domain